MSTQNGEPLAFINDGVMQHMRVGGGAGIGVRHLARRNAEIVGILGAGGMARTYLEAFCVVRQIKRAKVFSPTPANRERFAQEMSRKLDVDVVAVASAREAARGVDIFATCTDSMSPTFAAECRCISAMASRSPTGSDCSTIPISLPRCAIRSC